MSLIPSYYCQTVVSIGVYDDKANIIWISTSFFVGRKTSENSYKPFLITNKHVVKDKDLIVIRMVEKNTGNLESIKISLKQNNIQVTYHPYEKIDIVAITLNGSAIMSRNL